MELDPKVLAQTRFAVHCPLWATTILWPMTNTCQTGPNSLSSC